MTSARSFTVAEAIDAYEADLRRRGGDPGNATRLRVHLSAAFASKPIPLLTKADLLRWVSVQTDEGLTPGSLNRNRNGLRAALTLAVKGNRSIANRHIWGANSPRCRMRRRPATSSCPTAMLPPSSPRPTSGRTGSACLSRRWRRPPRGRRRSRGCWSMTSTPNARG